MDDGYRVHPLGLIEEISGAREEPDLLPHCTVRIAGSWVLVWWRAILRWATPAPTMPEVAGSVKVNHCEHRMRDRPQFDEIRRCLLRGRKWS